MPETGFSRRAPMYTVVASAGYHLHVGAIVCHAGACVKQAGAKLGDRSTDGKQSRDAS